MTGLRFETMPDGTTRAFRGLDYETRQKLAEYRVVIECPLGVDDLRADDALEQADKIMRNELASMVRRCPALDGFRVTIERLDE